VEREGQSLRIRRELIVRLPSAAIAAADRPAFRRFGQAVLRDLRAPVVF